MTTDPRPCTGPDADLWTSDAPEDRVVAAGMCGGCPELVACREGAMERKEAHGVWGAADHSFGTRTSAFSCGTTGSDHHGCARPPVGYGWRVDRYGRRLVPACIVHAIRESRPTLIKRETSLERAQRLANLVHERRAMDWTDERIISEIGMSASGLSKLFYRNGMRQEAAPFERLAGQQRRKAS